MTFTYVGDLSTDLDKVRFYIGDVTENSGPLPDSSNFSDAELGGLITTEGSWQRAVAGAFEVLAARYASLVDFAVGPRKENLSQASKAYESKGKEWRDKYGSASTAGTRVFTKIDGYSDDIAADEV